MTTIDQHEISGPTYDAISCMGGGYHHRFVALDRRLGGELPEEYDPLRFHEPPEMQPIIQRGSAAMAALLEAHAG